MTNFIFKSANRLIKNSPITLDNLMVSLTAKLLQIQTEQRHQRQDFVDVKLMINKLLIDKHLQFQVDDYFEKSERPETEDLD